MISPNCPLCEAAKITPWYFEDEECWIALCEICDVPMVVWKIHDPHPSDAVRERLWGHLRRVVEVDLGGGEFRIDDVMRQIPDHYHAHARGPSPLNRFLGGATTSS